MHQGQRVSTLRNRFWVESVAAGFCTFLFVVTLAWHDWLELAFGIDPDGGSGAVEWLIVGVTAALAVTCALLARVEWRRARPATA